MNDIKLSLHTWETSFESDATAQLMRQIASANPSLLGCTPQFNMQNVRENLPVLRQMMEQGGMDMKNELQLLLILEHPDFYLLQNRSVGSITGMEISLAAKRLHQKTGLTMEVIYKQLAVLCYAVNITYAVVDVPVAAPEPEPDSNRFEDVLLQSEGVPSFGFVIPASVYEEEKRRLDDLFAQKQYKELLEKAAPLCEMGVPSAVYYTGRCYLNGNGVKQDTERGARLLKIAARGGEMRAWNVLGDYYRSSARTHPQRMEFTYRCYTIFGGEPLDEAQRTVIDTMRDNRKRYAQNFIWSGIFLAVTVLLLFLLPTLFGPVRLWAGILFTVLNALVYLGCFWLQKKMLHTDIMRRSIPIMFIGYAVFLCIWITGLPV